MAEEPKAENEQERSARGKDEVALELMKFIAVSTGYGKAAQGGAGFSSKPGGRSAEEQADALIELFKRCRNVVKEEN
ncbi:MAG TPA: hypothetical protein VMU19_12325 [Bryobacteraceae bacterium]|nr:hypothetical protein [Bryobacteraceae bacterium]